MGHGCIQFCSILLFPASRLREAAWGNRLGAKVGSALSPVVMRRIQITWLLLWTRLSWLRAFWRRHLGCIGRFCSFLRLSGCSLAGRLLFVLVPGRNIWGLMDIYYHINLGYSFPEQTFLAGAAGSFPRGAPFVG